MQEKILINNQIKAEKVRVIDENGKNLGIFDLSAALEMAKEKGLDLILVSEKATPPVCKIGDYGKYLYQLQKKEKKIQKGGEIKVVRIGFNISPHDLETKVAQTEKFLKKGQKVRVEMILRGRERLFENLAKEKFDNFLNLLKEKVSFKIERELKKEPKGFTLFLTKS